MKPTHNRPKTFVGIQYLRGFAALAVVFHHIFTTKPLAAWAPVGAWGVWGVDVFFVISGFIMGQTLKDQHLTAGQFLRQRFVRVFPLYWLALSAWIIVRSIIPDRLGEHDITASTIAQSYLLIPHFHAVFKNHIWPILIVGWTLQLEIFFYVILSGVISIFSRFQRPLSIILMIGLVLSGRIFQPHSAILVTYTSPLLLEFAAGLFISMTLPLIQRRSTTILCILAILIGMCGAASIFYDSGWLWMPGASAASLVAAAVVLEKEFTCDPIKPLLLLGNASYSLYLTHGLAIAFVALCWERLGLPMAPNLHAVGAGAVDIMAALVLGYMSFRFLERPLLRLLKPSIPTLARARTDVEISTV